MGNRHFSQVALGLLLAAAGSLTGCTRDVPQKASITVEMPNSLSSVGTGAETLEIVIINARATPTSVPRAWEFEFKNSGPILGSTVPITVQGDIPTSKTLLVQVLGVFRKDSGTMRFAYGDAVADSTVAGDINLTISTAIFGSSAREGRMGGRYLTSVSPNGNLTGQVITMFSPPTGKPDMAVGRDDIVNGWFNSMVLDGTQAVNDINLKYIVLKDDGTSEAMFPNATGLMNLSNPLFANGNPNAVTAKVVLPARYRVENENGVSSLRPAAATEMYLGYFSANYAAIPLSGYKACQPGAAQTIDDTFVDTNADGVPDAPMGFVDAGGDPNYGSSPWGSLDYQCTGLYISHLKFYKNRLTDEHDAFGISGPFVLQDASAQSHDGYLRIDLDPTGNIGYPRLTLGWTYLPGVYVPTGGSGVNGVSVYAKSHSTGYSYGGQDKDDLSTCDTAASAEGMTFIGDVAGASSQKVVDSPPGGGYFTMNYPAANSVYGYYYRVCPYRLTSTGTKKYYREGIVSGCVGGCGSNQNMIGFGHKIPGYAAHDKTISSAVSFTDGNVGGGTARVVNYTLGANSTTLTFYNPMPNLTADREILLIVNSADGSSCGTGIGPGMYASTRAIAVAGNQVEIPRGTFVDTMLPAGLNLSTLAGGHCFLQAVGVAEFGDLTLTSTSYIYADPFSGVANSMGGGIVAIRVNGTFNFGTSASLIADGAGYDSVENSSGVGMNGAVNNYLASSMAGAGGGGHIGLSGALGSGGLGGGYVGANGAPGAAGGGGGPTYGLHLLMGSSGGSGYTAGAPSTSNKGGRGGGIVMVFARKVVANSGAMLSAGGTSAYSPVTYTNPPGGGGGAGTVILQTTTLTGAAPMLYAGGGMGGGSTNQNSNGQARSGGGGGGGFVQFRSCMPSGLVPNYDVSGGVRSNQSTFADESTHLSTVGQPGFADGPSGAGPMMDGCL